MAWGTLAAAALGAVFGVGSTVITDTLRSRRDLDQRWSDTKRTVYVRFLTALSHTHSRMVRAAFSGLPAEERTNAVHEAFHSDPQHSEARSVIRELGITAPNDIYRLASTAYQQLLEIRDVLALPEIMIDSEPYRAIFEPFLAELQALQEAMRDDLQPVARQVRRSTQPGFLRSRRR
jgi:hypothetical protein